MKRNRMSGSKLNVKNEKPISSMATTTKNLPEWKGVNLDEICKGRERFDFQEFPPINPSTTHEVLFSLPLSDVGPPNPLPQREDKWSQGFVKIPCSPNNLCPIIKEGKGKELRNRWEIIREALLHNFTSSIQLETAILSYNPEFAQKWKFSALHHFFDKVADKDQKKDFFKTLLPKIIDLALQLPTLITGPIPLLKSCTNASISLSQLQAASLIANAFLCTFPRHPPSEYKYLNEINFNKIFSGMQDGKRYKWNMMMEKLKFILNYFKRVTTKTPEGTLTIQRRYIPQKNCPKWATESQKLPSLHITSKGTIETEGVGFLQVDFADKYIGGKLMGWGCVQEEILFLLYPELIVSMLVTEVLGETEAVVVNGVERFNKHEGYGISLKWAGDFFDETPQDQSGRRKSSFVAIDATSFRIIKPPTQYSSFYVLRELNKAFVGFSRNDSSNGDDLPPVATGNWGCGVFKGDPKLKTLLQLMAAGISGRSVIYFTFGNAELRDSVSEMYWHLVQHNVSIGRLFSILLEFDEFVSQKRQDLYSFLYEKVK